jgi:hypothetical protein
MIPMIALGLFTTLFGVTFGCTVIELTLRAIVLSLSDHTAKGRQTETPFTSVESGARGIVLNKTKQGN